MGIKLENISHKYSDKYVIKNINLDIKKGMTGLLGKNGAGKTTLMRIITTMIKPTEGTIKLDGIESKKENYNDIRKMIGYLPQDFGMYPQLSVEDSLDFFAVLYGMNYKKRKHRIKELLEMVNLTEHRKKKVRALSGGMKRRLGLAQALLNNPQILIVDEPTAGLDPEERIRLRTLLTKMAKEKTVLLSTHIIEDIACTCNNLVVINKGSIAYKGNVKNIMNISQGHVWEQSISSQEELETFRNKYKVINTSYLYDNITVKFINDTCIPGSKKVVPSLEDSYMYLIKNDERVS